MSSKLNIIIPNSTTTNNIYSLSELIYLVGLLRKFEFEVTVHLADLNYLKKNNICFTNAKNILLLMWDGFELIKWLDGYNKFIKESESVIYGLTASVYGKYIMEDYSCISEVFYLNDYQSLLFYLNINNYDKLNANIKQFPATDLDILDKIPIVPLVSSIGCINACNFCPVGCSNRKSDITYSFKSADEMYTEILEHYRKGRRLFYFVDSCFLINSKQRQKEVIKLCKSLYYNSINISFYIETRIDTINAEVFSWLKKAGLKRVLLGVENINNNVLKRYNKNINKEQVISAVQILQRLKINIDMTMILFDPDTNLDEIKENIYFVLENNLIKYIGLRGLFRRLILIPHNKIPFRNLNLQYFYDDELPFWLNKSYNYVVPDYKSALFERFIRKTEKPIQDIIDDILQHSGVLGIKDKRNLRVTLENEFLSMYCDVANKMDSITTLQEMLAYFNEFKEKRMNEYGERADNRKVN